MFVGRSEEIKFLEKCYESMNSQLIILYGREGVGKTDLIKEFVKDKAYKYKLMNDCSFSEPGGQVTKGDEDSERTIYIYDEFQYGVKNDENFASKINDELNKTAAFVILISSSVSWVESDMVSDIKDIATKITSFLKLKEFSLMELVSRFPKFNLMDCIRTYSVTGGIPKYLALWNEKDSFEGNVKRLYLNKDGALYNETKRFLKNELRELPVYNTILYALASGMNKLNDINTYTGYGRAKISVYIKNLIGLDIVEKVFSYDTSLKENTKKGVYRIKDFYILFYYRYIFPNKSLVEFNGVSSYDLILKDSTDDIFKECFVKVCIEYLDLMNVHGRLPVKVVDFGSWYGKKGDIDYIGKSEDGKMIVSFFTWSNEPVGVGSFGKYNELLDEAGIEPDYLYLFSKSGFTDELKGAVYETVKLIALNEM